MGWKLENDRAHKVERRVGGDYDRRNDNGCTRIYRCVAGGSETYSQPKHEHHGIENEH